MASQIMNHTCGYFCQDGRHAVEAIARPDIGANEIFDGYEAYLREHGWRAVSIRAAPEADTEAWKGKMGWHYDQDLQIRVGGPGAFPKGVVCWLVMIEPVGHSDGQA